VYEYDTHQMMSPDGFDAPLGRVPDFFPEAEPEDTRTQGDFDAEFEYLFQPQAVEEEMPPASRPAPPPSPPPVKHRRKRPRLVRPQWPIVLGVTVAAVTGAVTSTVSVLGAMVSYGPLRRLASPTAHGLDWSWPLLVYGPWLAGCLFVLHATAHRRPTRTGWIAVFLFSVIAMALCIAHAPRTVTASATAGLPPFSALAGFLLLSRHITLLRPGQAKIPRQRRRKH
jgi:quinol-cytochrome oxidoreductase complex cytochrome b subunit